MGDDTIDRSKGNPANRRVCDGAHDHGDGASEVATEEDPKGMLAEVMGDGFL